MSCFLGAFSGVALALAWWFNPWGRPKWQTFVANVPGRHGIMVLIRDGRTRKVRQVKVVRYDVNSGVVILESMAGGAELVMEGGEWS